MYHTSVKYYQIMQGLMLLIPSVLGIIPSTNSTASGNMNVLPYSSLFSWNIFQRVKGDEVPKSFLEGFDPFGKYDIAKKFLKNREKKGHSTADNFIDKTVYKKTILSVFYTEEYFNTLKRGWNEGNRIYIYDMYFENFLTMVNMANIPYFSKKEGLSLTSDDINIILSLYEIFGMNNYERIPLSVRREYDLDMTKRECFKENLRWVIETNMDATSNDEYTKILRDIRYDGRPVLITEVPHTTIENINWVKWVLSRANNLDIVWYLFSTLCNTGHDIQKRHIVTYVKETYVLGKKGLQVYFSKEENLHLKEYITLSYYLLFNNPLTVENIEVSIQENIEVPEMQFSSVMEVFRRTKVVYITSLGNNRDINKNLSLINIILDIEKKRKERQMSRVLKGFVVYDYDSINEFAKKQLLELNLPKVGFMTRVNRSKCCVDGNDSCLYKLNHRDPNFLGLFSIPQGKKNKVTSLSSPYSILFNEINMDKLGGLDELNIYIKDLDMNEPYKESELPYYLRQDMNIKTVRIFGSSNKQEASYVDMFKKALKIVTLSELDISSVLISNESIVSALESTDNFARKSIKKFTFTYFETSNDFINGGSIGGISTSDVLNRIIEFLPNLKKLNVRILNDREEAIPFLVDFKYALGCRKRGLAPEAVKKIITIQMSNPLAFTSTRSCDDIMAVALSRLGPSIRAMFKQTRQCPSGANSWDLAKMTKDGFIKSLKHIIQTNTCRPDLY